jgi:kynurenine formamidase
MTSCPSGPAGTATSTTVSRYHLHPYLSLEAAPRWLVDRGVKLLALAVATPDMPGVIRAPGFDWPIHHLLLGAGCVAENLNRFDQVVGKRFRTLPCQFHW